MKKIEKRVKRIKTAGSKLADLSGILALVCLLGIMIFFKPTSRSEEHIANFVLIF